MINLKAIFNQIYFFMIISEFVILIATGLIYVFKADNVTKKALEQKSVLNIISRDSYIEYFSKKMRIILEDELFIIKTYLNIKNWNIKKTKYENLKYAPDITEVRPPWYFNSSNYSDYFKGQYNQESEDICTPEHLANFDKLSEFLAKLFNKYFNWKNKTYVNVEYLYIATNTGCFYKFPAIKSGWAQVNYTVKDIELCANRSNPNPYFTPFNDPTKYDPRCRPFYYSSIISEDKISFTTPYQFSSGNWLNDICIRTDLINGTAPEIVLCMVINYYDLDVFRDKIDEYKELTELMLIHHHYDNESKKLNVIYDSSYFISEMKCHQNDSKCVPINFFDVYYKSILDELYKDSPSNYLENYNYLKENNAYKNLEEKLINIAEKDTQELLKINIDNFDPDSVYIAQEKTAELNDGEIKYVDKDEKLYLFPILSSFDYIQSGDKNEFQLIKGKSSKSEFFLIIRELSNSKNEEKIRFLRVAITEIFLFLFYILSFNTLIWFVFNIIYYYIIKGLTYSLKQIRRLYLLILSQVTNTGDEMLQKANKLLNEIGININTNDENDNDKDSKDFLNSIQIFINEYIIKSIHNISQMENHIEIQQSFVTLKAIMIILLYNNSKHKNKLDKTIGDNTNFTTENKNGLDFDNNGIGNNNIIKKDDIMSNSDNQFISVIKFFSNCFYSQSSNKILIDYSLVKIIIENIFTSMLHEFNQLKQQFVENPSRVFENLSEKLLKIDEFYFITKQAISNSKKEFELNRTSKRENQDKNDLLLLSLLEENLNYLYSVHKCSLLDALLSYKINENINLGENIDEEEETLLEKLKKKEKKNKNNKRNKNDDDNKINMEEKIKSIFSSIKLGEDYSCNEESKIYIQSIIKYCEDYLEIKDTNIKDMKKMNKNYIPNNYFSSTMNNLFNTTIRNIEPFTKRKRVEDIISEFKVIFISLEISMYHIICEEGQKSFENFENALNRYRHFEKMIDNYKKKSKSEWKLTNFTMFFINSIFYEKILVIFSFLCHKFSQYKTELFINLNILDFSPLYSLTTRRIIITKIINYIYNVRKSLVQKSNDSISSYTYLIENNNYIDIQRSIYKMICLRNIISKDAKKRVLFVFDLNNKYIKDMVFKEIMFNYFKNYCEEIKSNNFEYFFCAFDHKLHFQFEPNYSDEITKGKKYAKNYIIVINNDNNNQINNKENIRGNNDNGMKLMSNYSISKNISMTSPKKVNLNYNNINNNNNNQNNNNLDNLEEFFKFIKNYKGDKKDDINSNQSNQEHRADKALYHSVLFGFENTNDYSNINRFFRKNKYNKYTSSYLILMTNLSSTFTNHQSNWEKMAQIIYEKKVSVIVVISYDPSFDNNQILKEKISYYKNFLKTNMIDGYLFIMRSLTLLKFILNSIFPIKFSKFNIDILKHYLCSNEDINLSRPRAHP